MELACVSDQIIQLQNLHQKNLAASNYDLSQYKSELDKLTSSMQAKEADHLQEMRKIQSEVEQLVTKFGDREHAQNEIREVINAKKNKYKRTCLDMVIQIQTLKKQINDQAASIARLESPRFGVNERRGREKVRWAQENQDEAIGSDKENEFNYF